MLFQRQRRAKDVPKTEALREDVKDADSKDKDTKDKLDVFLMPAEANKMDAQRKATLSTELLHPNLPSLMRKSLSQINI